MMYILMDLEWYSQKGKPTMLTQIAALCADSDWNAVESFYSRIHPRYDDISDWSHMAFSGGTRKEFEAAPTLCSVLDDLKAWLREDDILCWWTEEGKKKLDRFLAGFSITFPSAGVRILQDYAVPIAHRRGADTHSLYKMAWSLGFNKLGQTHFSANDVEIMRMVLKKLMISQASLSQPPKRTLVHGPIQSPIKPFQYDVGNNILHRRDCSYIPSGAMLRDCDSLNICIRGKAIACPHCIGDEARAASRERMKQIIRDSNYTFVFSPDAKVFHLANCPYALSAKRIMGAGQYGKCTSKGMRPCKHCKPSLKDEIPITKTPASLPPKKELQAVIRFERARRERGKAEFKAMSDQERRDFITLTNPGYAFWAAAGYGTFHRRDCRKLKELTRIQGFPKYDDAIHAGYTPCKYCKPTKKQDVVYSIPMSNQMRDEESPADLVLLCENAGFEYSQEADIFSFRTKVGRWKIHLEAMPVTVEHLNLTMATDDPSHYHRQPRVFLSLKDAFLYIKQHDESLLRKGRRALQEGPG